MVKTLVLNKEQLAQKVDRLAWQIYEQNYKEKEIIIAGIASRGVLISKRIAKKLTEISTIKLKLATIRLDKENPYNDIDVDISEKEYKDKVLILRIKNTRLVRDWYSLYTVKAQPRKNSRKNPRVKAQEGRSGLSGLTTTRVMSFASSNHRIKQVSQRRTSSAQV